MIWIIFAIVAVLILYDGIPLFLSRVVPLAVFKRGPKEKVVFLTFDDGPDKAYTPLLLDVLKQCDVKATFFIIAQKAKQRSDLVQRMIQEGHQIEVHGYTHACVPLLMPAASMGQITQSIDVLSSQFGLVPTWYRPPWGLINLPAWLAAKQRRMRIIIWSIMVGDWRCTAPDLLLQRITRKLHDGAVIVLHDSDETAGAEPGAPINVIEMMPRLVNEIRNRGYAIELLNKWM